jgi:hypothetical protein
MFTPGDTSFPGAAAANDSAQLSFAKGPGDTERREFRQDSTQVPIVTVPSDVLRPENTTEKYQRSESINAPAVIVDKVDGKPAFGDDFGDQATPGQQLAHELRAADATPDKVTVHGDAAPLLPHEMHDTTIPSSADVLGNELENGPLLSHETASSEDIGHPSDDEPSPAVAFGAINFTGASIGDVGVNGIDRQSDEISLTRDETFSGNADEADEFTKAPLMSYETGFSQEEILSGDADDTDEFEIAPLMSHETGYSRGGEFSGDESETDEFDKAPLLSPETGFSPGESNETSEFENAPMMTHEAGSTDESTYTHTKSMFARAWRLCSPRMWSLLDKFQSCAPSVSLIACADMIHVQTKPSPTSQVSSTTLL